MQNDIRANTNKRERMRMASDGENVEALVTKNEPEVLAELIKNGYAQNHYEEWKTHEHGTVRYALACTGLYPETFINDKNPSVREAAVRHHPEYCGQLLARNKKRHWEFVCDLINTRTDLKWVKEFLDAKVPKAVDKGKLHAIRIYYATRTLEPTMMEKTMSPEQLFQVHSPFWATGLTITHIRNILEVYPQVEPTAFFEYFDQLLDEEQHWVTSHMLYKRYRKGTE